MSEILCTKDYSKFAWHPEQRGIDPLLVLKLQKSMTKRGFIPSSHIVVDKQFRILDGQHRFQAAKNLGLSIYYIVEESLHVEDVRDMAKAHKQWNIEDFVTSHIRQGNDNYKRLYKWKEKSSLNWEAFLRAGMFGSQFLTTREMVINGSLILTERKEAEIEEFLEKFLFFREIMPRGYNHRHFVGACAFIFAHPQYDHKQMMHRSEYQRSKFFRCPDTGAYVQMLSEVYNYNSHSKNIVNFGYNRRPASN